MEDYFLLLFLVIFYFWIGWYAIRLCSMAFLNKLWEYCRGDGKLFCREKSGKEKKPCKLGLCCMARKLGFDKIEKDEIKDFSPEHPRCFKILQICGYLVWPVTILVALLVNVFIKLKKLLSVFSDIRRWWKGC